MPLAPVPTSALPAPPPPSRSLRVRRAQAVGALLVLVALIASALVAERASGADPAVLLPLGDTPALPGADPGATSRPVAAAATDDGSGAWVATADGGVFTYGGAPFHGSLGGVRLARPVVDLDPTPSGGGYWLLGADGGVFTFGDAAFHGSTGGLVLNAPVVALVPTPTGRGYWLVASDGGLFSFGDARFLGSAGGMALSAPVVDAAATPTGRGYWMAGADGGVLTFGDAPFAGSLVGQGGGPVRSLAPAPDGQGYTLLHDVGVAAFGSAGAPGALAVPEGRVAVDLVTGAGGATWALLAPRPSRVDGPPLPAGSGEDLGRRVVYSNSAQRVWLVGDDGAVERTYPVSGRQGVPGPGVYHVWSRSPLAWAGHDGITMRLMVRFARTARGGNIGFHTIPERADGRPLQTEEELGRYRSAGCVRQGEADARFMWDWAQLGTVVVVLP